MTDLAVVAIVAIVFIAEIRVWWAERSVEATLMAERAYWQQANEKLLNRIHDPATETARSQIAEDVQVPSYSDPENEARMQQFDRMMIDRGIDPSSLGE